MFLFPDNFYQHTLSWPAVEFSGEDLLSWAEIERPIGDRDDDFASHDLALNMRVCIIFACVVVAILTYRLVRRAFLQPLFVIPVQTMLIVVDED